MGLRAELSPNFIMSAIVNNNEINRRKRGQTEDKIKSGVDEEPWTSYKYACSKTDVVRIMKNYLNNTTSDRRDNTIGLYNLGSSMCPGAATSFFDYANLAIARRHKKSLVDMFPYKNISEIKFPHSENVCLNSNTNIKIKY